MQVVNPVFESSTILQKTVLKEKCDVQKKHTNTFSPVKITNTNISIDSEKHKLNNTFRKHDKLSHFLIT